MLVTVVGMNARLRSSRAAACLLRRSRRWRGRPVNGGAGFTRETVVAPAPSRLGVQWPTRYSGGALAAFGGLALSAVRHAFRGRRWSAEARGPAQRLVNVVERGLLLLERGLPALHHDKILRGLGCDRIRLGFPHRRIARLARPIPCDLKFQPALPRMRSRLEQPPLPHGIATAARGEDHPVRSIGRAVSNIQPI
jgi:hypothetical protein